MAKTKIGDIVEIRTKKGLAYAQYAHKHKQYGAMLRVFEGFHETRPNSYVELIKNRPKFICFFPLNVAVDRGIVSVVDSIALPNEAQAFPLFRAGVMDPSTRKVAIWWLWDGEKEWRVGDLSTEQRKFPIRGVWNDTLLIERIESGWSPEIDPT